MTPAHWDDIDEDVHDHKRADRSRQHTTMALMPIPDLRFESTYLKSVQNYVTVTVRSADGDKLEKEIKDEWEQGFEKVTSVHESRMDDSITLNSDGGDDAMLEGPVRNTMDVDVRWKGVVWVTIRDQLMMPFLQGLLWAIASSYIAPFGAEAGSKAGTFIRTHIPTKEGLGIGWLRSWAKSLGLSSSGSGTSGFALRNR